MCILDSYKAGLFGHFRLTHTCVRMIHKRQINTYRCILDSYSAGLFRDYRLTRTCVRLIDTCIRLVSLVTLDYIPFSNAIQKRKRKFNEFRFPMPHKNEKRSSNPFLMPHRKTKNEMLKSVLQERRKVKNENDI